jgi:hypothetical protein
MVPFVDNPVQNTRRNTMESWNKGDGYSVTRGDKVFVVTYKGDFEAIYRHKGDANAHIANHVGSEEDVNSYNVEEMVLL